MGILLLKIFDFKVIFMENRTDLALESYESSNSSSLDGVEVEESGELTIVKITNENGAKALNKPVGMYITLSYPSLVDDSDSFNDRVAGFVSALERVLPKNPKSVLVAGLGNNAITADSLGPKTNKYVLSTRHIIEDLQRLMNVKSIVPVSSIATGVLGETGIETAEIIFGVAEQIKPSCVIVVDALAASSTQRLGTTVQLSNSGISPGSGVGNHRFEISESTLGVPVVAIGIPTVVCTSIISGNENDTAFVTPREIDRITEQGAKLIGFGINSALQSEMSLTDLYSLVG